MKKIIYVFVVVFLINSYSYSQVINIKDCYANSNLNLSNIIPSTGIYSVKVYISPDANPNNTSMTLIPTNNYNPYYNNNTKVLNLYAIYNDYVKNSYNNFVSQYGEMLVYVYVYRMCCADKHINIWALTPKAVDFSLPDKFCKNQDSVPLFNHLIYYAPQQTFNTHSFNNTNLVNNNILYLNNTPGLYNNGVSISLTAPLYNNCVIDIKKDIYINEVPLNTSFNIPPDTFIIGSTPILDITNYANSSNATVSYYGTSVTFSGGNYYYDGSLNGPGNDVVEARFSVTSGSLTNNTLNTCYNSLYDTLVVISPPSVPSQPDINISIPNTRITRDTAKYTWVNNLVFTTYSDYYAVMCENDSTVASVKNPNPNYKYQWYQKVNNQLLFLDTGTTIYYKIPINNSTEVSYLKVRACNFLNQCGSFRNVKIYQYAAPPKPILDSSYCVNGFVAIKPAFNNIRIDSLITVNGIVDSSLYYEIRNYVFNGQDTTHNYIFQSTDFLNYVTYRAFDYNQIKDTMLPLNFGTNNPMIYYGYDQSKRECYCNGEKDSVVAFHSPIIDIIISGSHNLVEGELVHFYNQSQYDYSRVNKNSVYVWNFGDGAYSFTEDPFHYYYVSGYHDVTLTVTSDSSGCTADTTFLNFVYVSGTATTSIEELKQKGITLNQTSTAILIQNSNIPNNDLNCILYNMQGKEISRVAGKGNVKLFTGGLASGIYVLKINNYKPVKLFLR